MTLRRAVLAILAVAAVQCTITRDVSAQLPAASFARWDEASLSQRAIQPSGVAVRTRSTRALEGGIIGGVLFAALGGWLGHKACLSAAPPGGNCAGVTIVGGGLGAAIGVLIGYGFGREIKR
jgi:uncharacterized membrane protein